MTYDEWVEKYRPEPNHLYEHASFEGTMFETYGDEWNYVRSVSRDLVWTFISDGEGDRIEPGLRIVDRLGYFVASVPRGEDAPDYIEFELDSEPVA